MFFKKLREDYLESRFSKYEGFLEWYLKRKLSFWGKIGFSCVLWVLWLYLFFHPVYVIYLFCVVIILSIIVIIVEIYDKLKTKKGS